MSLFSEFILIKQNVFCETCRYALIIYYLINMIRTFLAIGFVLLIQLRIYDVPNYYYKLSNRSKIPVNNFRKFEKLVYRLGKLKLDKKYFENCIELNVVPKFLRFKIPGLSTLQKSKHVFQFQIFI